MSRPAVVELDLPAKGDLVLHLDLRLPGAVPIGTVLIAHGFLGYKDYGMLPRIAETVASTGWAAVSFNFAHSGMSRAIETFEHPDRFEQSTWNRQIEDLVQLVEAIRNGSIAPGLSAAGPVVLLGHSRGGTTALLATGRGLEVQGVVAIAAPANTLRLPPEDRRTLLEKGTLGVVSARTGQELRVGRAMMEEINADPAGHDLTGMVSAIRCPMLLVHGESDATIPVADVDRIAAAAVGCADLTRVVLEDGNHVLNVENPLPSSESSPQLDSFLKALGAFLAKVASFSKPTQGACS